MKNSNPIYLICDNIRSLYNVGAIFRTSDAANIAKIYLCGITGYPKNNDPNWFQTKKIEKTALGANKTVSWEYCKDTRSVIKKLKKEGIIIYVLENIHNSHSYSSVKYKFPCAIVLGHETKGVSDNVISLANAIINIPMYGKKTSLNVEAAYAICVYEIIKHLQ